MNDLVYNEIIATPGFELEFAVGTTYSLDAEIFMALSLAFARYGEVSDADFQNPIRLLAGLRQATDRIVIFCNRGGVQPPLRKNILFAMLDKCVFEVTNAKEPLANFHPKIWIIKERSLENRNFRQIKLIVLSRNLTKDTSLDVAVTMTAPLGVNPDAKLRRKHEPLKLLLEELSNFTNPDKRKGIKRLIKDIDTMGPFELDNQYIDYDFIPLHFGINMNQNIDLRNEMPGQKMMIVSPFIDKTGTITLNGKLEKTPVNWLNDYAKKQDKVLVTRLESLTPEIMDLYSGDKSEVWVISQAAEQNDILPMNLHAKMYFSWGCRQGGINLWLGSANATHSGFYRNSEFLLRLTLRRGKNQFESFKAEFCDEKKQLCQRVTSLPESPESDKEDYTLAIKVRRNLINHNNLSATVTPTQNGYEIKIAARKIKDIPGVIKIAPMQEPFNEAELSLQSKECVISVSQTVNLSEFYILSVTPLDGYKTDPVRMVIKIPTKGIPEDRDDRIYRSLIDTPDKFLNYVELLITDHPLELTTLFTSLPHENALNVPVSFSQRSTALYESLLKIAATNPDKLEDIQDIVNRVDSKVIPESFRQIADTFKKSLKKLRK